MASTPTRPDDAVAAPDPKPKICFACLPGRHAILPTIVRGRRQDGSVVENNSEEQEILKLSLAQLVASPDVWRARAVSAGGFLGAAAAISLWGVSRQQGGISDAAMYVTFGAATSYVSAVVLFLAASVWPKPRAKPDDGDSLADQAEAIVRREAWPIKLMVLIGAGLGGLAIVATTVASFLLLFQPVRTAGTVTLVGTDYISAARQLCPGLGEAFAARVSDDGPGYVRVTIEESECGPGRHELVVPRVQLLLIRSTAQ